MTNNIHGHDLHLRIRRDCVESARCSISPSTAPTSLPYSALTYRAGFGNDLVTFMVAHGVVELSCIFIAGGAGLLIGSAILMPGDLTRADALRTRGMEAVRLMMGVALLLVIAGTIEGFISPAPIDPRIKYSIAAITGVALYAYLLLVGHEVGACRSKQEQVQEHRQVSRKRPRSFTLLR